MPLGVQDAAVAVTRGRCAAAHLVHLPVSDGLQALVVADVPHLRASANKAQGKRSATCVCTHEATLQRNVCSLLRCLMQVQLPAASIVLCWGDPCSPSFQPPLLLPLNKQSNWSNKVLCPQAPLN